MCEVCQSQKDINPGMNRKFQKTLGDAYDVYDTLGTGAFTEIYEGYNRITKTQVAIKMLNYELGDHVIS